MTTSHRASWHIAHWHWLAWLETLIKAIAFLFAIPAGLQALTDGAFAVPGGETLVQLVIMAILTLGLVVAIYDRIIEREIIALVFTVVNVLAHLSMVVTLLASQVTAPIIGFCGFMLLGDLVKLVFLATTDFTVRDTPRAVMYGLILMYVGAYTALLLIAWL
ncbi:MAG: hypothetical protein Kow0077_01720 [Anaerolineae bacterium]